jgi:outer membrane protein, adhesin transport system
MKSRAILFALISVFYEFSGYAQELYDLNRCVSTGLENNFSILIAKNREQIARNNYTPGNAGLLPTLDVSSSYGGTINNTTKEFTSGLDTTVSGVHNVTASAGVNLDWTIFRGFTALTTYKKLNELKMVGELNTQMAVENLVADIASEFYFYIQQIQLYENLEHAVALSRERVRIDRERYLLGAASKLDLLQSMVYLNSDSSRHSKQREVLRTSQVRLNKLMSMENLGQDIIPADSVIEINPGLQYDSLLAMTDASNTSLLIARKTKKISAYDYKIIAGRTYPYLSLGSGYSYNFYQFENNDLRRQQVDGLNYGVTLGFTVFDGFNQHRQKANARIEMDNQEYAFKQVDQQVKGDLITIFYAYQNNLLLLSLEKQNLATAQENLQIALERYKLGSLSGLELREVQQSLLEAEERLISVQYQTKVAEISLLQISGRVMEYVN